MDISIGSYKFRLEIVVLIIIAFWVMFGHMLCSCCNVSFKEGFAAAQIAYNGASNALSANGSYVLPKIANTEGFVGANNSANGPEFAANNSPDWIRNPKLWSKPTLLYTPGKKPSPGVKAIWDRPKQPIPLPTGEMYFWATTPFKPECCPSYMSSSTGCACITVDQYNYLKERGGNNVPYSEY